MDGAAIKREEEKHWGERRTAWEREGNECWERGGDERSKDFTV